MDIELLEEEEVVPTRIKREPSGVIPITPRDGTCADVCDVLNNEIDAVSKALDIRYDELEMMGAGTERMKTKRQANALTNKITALKDLRFTFANKGVCKCFERRK